MSLYPVLIALLLCVQLTLGDLHNANDNAESFGKRTGEDCPSVTFYGQGFEDISLLSNEGYTTIDHGFSPYDSTLMQGFSERFPAQDGSPTSYATFYSSTSTSGTISYWLITGTVDFSLGVAVSFWTRTATDIAVAATRLYVRYSGKGADLGFTTNNPSDLGYFTNTPVVINEAMAYSGYPTTWTKYSFSIPPQPGVSGRIAFHSFMEAGAGYETRFFGIDSLTLGRYAFYTQAFNSVPFVFSNEFYDGFDHSSANVEYGVVQGNPDMFSARNPPENSYAGIYSATSSAGILSNWLVTGTVDYTNGVTVSFWTRTIDSQSAPSRLYARYSNHGDDYGFTTNSPTDLGYFTAAPVVINDAMALNGYPTTWTQYSYNIPPQPGVSGRIAFHFMVDSVSPSQNRYVGLDSIVLRNYCPEVVSDPIQIHGDCNPDCSCYSGFSGPSCDIRPPSACTFLPTQTLGTNFVPSLTFTTNNSRLIFAINAPVEQSKYITPALNDNLALSPPYSLGSYVVFGTGTGCDYPGSSLWNKAVANCQDTWIQELPWSTVRDTCKFSDPDGDLVFTQTVKISRVYALPSLDNVTALYRTEYIEKELSFAFPKSVPVSSNLAVNGNNNNKTEVALISAIYSPASDTWNIAFRVMSGIPYKVEQATGDFYGSVNITNLSMTISNANLCNGSAACYQTITAKIPGCQALNGELDLVLVQNCTGTCTPNSVSVTANIKTGDSCAVSNTIHFTFTSLSAFSGSDLTVSKTQFDTSETSYFGAILKTNEFDVSLLTFTVNSVCVTVGQGACTMVNFTVIPAVGDVNVAFSVALAQLKSLKTSSGVDTFSFQATISVSSINKRTQHASAIVNIGSTIYVTSEVDPQLKSDLVTFTFSSSSQMTQKTFKQGMATVLGITPDLIEIVQYTVIPAKRSAAYTVKAQFYILGDLAKEKEAELLQKVQNNDPLLFNSGFESPSVEVDASTTTGSNTGGDAPEQYVSTASSFGFSIVISVLMMLLL